MAETDATRGNDGRPHRHPDTPSPGERMAELVADRSHRLRPRDIPSLAVEAASVIGGRDVAVYLVDLEHRWLVPFGDVDGSPGPLSIDGTVAGRAFRSDRLVAGDDDSGHVRPVVWAPLVDGAERVGVLSVSFDEADELTLRRCGLLATMLAELIVSRNAYGDTILRTRRLTDMTLAAEVRWSQLPPLTALAPGVAISGLLEPAYEIAGDAFDYAINGEICQLAILDAMGHGLEASLMANLAVAAYRHGRRRGLVLHDLATVIDEAIASQFGEDRFVTGQLAHLDVTTGTLRWISAGHPNPLLLRGSKMVGELECVPRLPLGLGGGSSEVAHIDLEPGDRVLFYSDGVIEARSPGGELFGIDRLADLLERAAASEQPLQETTRRLVHSVLDHQQDRLQDDATVLLLEWWPLDHPLEQHGRVNESP